MDCGHTRWEHTARLDETKKALVPENWRSVCGCACLYVLGSKALAFSDVHYQPTSTKAATRHPHHDNIVHNANRHAHTRSGGTVED